MDKKWLVRVRLTDYSWLERQIAADSSREAIAKLLRHPPKRLRGTHGNAEIRDIEISEAE